MLFGSTEEGLAIDWINKGEVTTGINIAKAEQHYDAHYVADLCVKLPSGNVWSEDAVSVFWVEKPAKPEYSNYFGLFIRDGRAIITNALTAVDGVIFRGVKGDNGEIIFSRYRHDYRKTADGTAMADGGRDYYRGFGTRPVFLKVIGPEFFVASMTDLEMEAT